MKLRKCSLFFSCKNRLILVLLNYGDNMNYKKVFKRETKVIAYVVIALTLVVIGTSYALFLQVNNNRDNQVVTAGSLIIEYDKGNTIIVDENDENNCLIPQGDETGSGTGGCKFTLSVTNTGTLPMQYNLLIYDNVEEAPSDAVFVDHSLVRHSLNKQISKESTNMETVTDAKSLSELTLNEGKRTLESNIIEVGETITFSLNIWISEEATIDIIGQYVYLKLDVVGSVFEGSSAAKLLTSDQSNSSLEEIELPSTYNTEEMRKEYRYTGENPNNYIYFNCSDDSSLETCEVWRILGIYNGEQLKLIYDYTNLENAYSEEEMLFDESSINKYLNGEFYNSLSQTSKNQISPHVFKTIGTSSLEVTSMEIYDEEIAQENGTLINVGLMNASDYAFANSINNETLLSNLSSLNATNWLYSAKDEWLINQINSNVYSIRNDGNIVLSSPLDKKLIRPVVYLNHNVSIIKGDGTKANPYVLSK